MKKKIRNIICDTAHATLLADNGKPCGKGYQALYIMASGLLFVYTHSEKYEDIDTINAAVAKRWISTGYMTPVNDTAAQIIKEYFDAHSV